MIPMLNPNENRPLSELVSGLVSDISGLFRKEIDLAKTEASEKLSHAMGGVGSLVVGMIFAIGAIGVLLGAAVRGLSHFLINQGMTETGADALSAVIIGVIVAIIAWVMMSRGLSTIRETNLSLERTSSSLRRDADVVKERM
jgi:hypothetical protein